VFLEPKNKTNEKVGGMEKNQKMAKKIEVEELLKFPQLVERELEYWIKEKKISYIERAIKANDLNTRFAGTYSLDMVENCHPDDDDILDMMLEENEDFVESLAEAIELEDESFAEAG
jgi:hypothetical protein